MKLTYLLPLLGSAVLLTACNEDVTTSIEKSAQEQAAPIVKQTTSTATAPSPTMATEHTKPTSTSDSSHLFYKDTISGNDYKGYTFKGEKGQHILVNIKAQGDANAFLYGYDDFIVGESYTLPETKEYEVRVTQPRNSARQNKSSTFELDIELH